MKTYEQERNEFALENYDRSKSDVILGADWATARAEKVIAEKDRLLKIRTDEAVKNSNPENNPYHKTENLIHVHEVLPQDDPLMESYREMLEALKSIMNNNPDLTSGIQWAQKRNDALVAIQKAKKVLGDNK